MKSMPIILAVCWLCMTASAQKKAPNVITADIDNFWNAYDSICSTTDSLKQLQYIKTQYIDKGTPGLHAFMKVREITAEEWVKCIRHYPKFWGSIRSNTDKVKKLAPEFGPAIDKLRELYPALKPANIYFIIGTLRAGGTTLGDMVLIGSELVAGNAAIDISEFQPGKQKYLRDYYVTDPLKNALLLNIHEYVHTQQRCAGYNLLSQAICEGACDFVTELVTGKKIPLRYMDYGTANAKEVREKFIAEMYNPSFDGWMYNVASPNTPVGDLGYYVGYAICKAYYHRQKDKKAAVRQIIELNYSDSTAVTRFFKASGY
ncbi:DUF2268 domain-containing putative Zn-dependent protease [Chitinophaga varians]|uniref:DUF2268 domain-containing putative Zn-dependent protease n=1 Tax=Chitinophaga varians TaxID=2202339 RepID=UPI00165EF390|nr:hypothetical protein [Chitinophaga varians]MBC9914902.1 hypothetical protein [Chitinophaga varians]